MKKATRKVNKRSTEDQSMTMKKSWVMIKDRTDKEHEEQTEAC